MVSAEGGADPFLPMNLSSAALSCGCSADGDAETAAGAHCRRRAKTIPGRPLPELGEVVVHDRRNELGIHHLEQVVVLEIFRRRLDDDLLLAQRIEEFVSASRLW